MGIRVWVVIGEGLTFYVGIRLGGYEWPIFVGVNAFGYGKTGS